MRYCRLIIFLLTINILSCDKPTDKLFWISEQTNQSNDFLFMTESTNVEALKIDSLKLFLRADELQQLDTTTTSFKNFGRIYSGEKFQVFVLLRSINSSGRNYTFIIKTFDNDWRVIDDYELATWDDEAKKYCFGSISKNLIIERKCDKAETSDIMEITSEGKIIMTSLKKP